MQDPIQGKRGDGLQVWQLAGCGSQGLIVVEAVEDFRQIFRRMPAFFSLNILFARAIRPVTEYMEIS